MPFKLIPANRVLKVAFLIFCAAVGVALTYYSVRGKIAAPWSTVLTIAYLVLVGVLVRSGIAGLPPEYKVPFFGTRPKFADIAKAVGCALAALAWSAIGVRLVSDTNTGVALLFVPVVALILAMAFFLGRAFYWGQVQK